MTLFPVKVTLWSHLLRGSGFSNTKHSCKEEVRSHSGKENKSKSRSFTVRCQVPQSWLLRLNATPAMNSGKLSGPREKVNRN